MTTREEKKRPGGTIRRSELQVDGGKRRVAQIFTPCEVGRICIRPRVDSIYDEMTEGYYSTIMERGSRMGHGDSNDHVDEASQSEGDIQGTM